MWLPDDIVAEIAAHAPDPRPLLLTCRQFYRVFTELPDIAYWCSGCDPKYLLPKHVGRGAAVYTGTITDIIDTDNLAVFKVLYDPGRAQHYAKRAIFSGAAEILGFIIETSDIDISDHHTSVYGIAAACKKYFDVNMFADAVRYGALAPQLDLWYKCDKPRDLLPLDIATRYSPPKLSLFTSAAYVELCERMYPPPEYNIRALIAVRPTAETVLRYIKVYHKRVTLTVIAMATGRLRAKDVVALLRWCDCVSDPRHNLGFILNSTSFYCWSAEVRDYLASSGAKYLDIPNIDSILTNPTTIGLYLPERAAEVRELYKIAGDYYDYTPKLAKVCARCGIVVTPTVQSLINCVSVNRIIEHIRANNSLITSVPSVVASRSHSIDFNLVLRRLEEFHEVPGYSETVANIKKIANYGLVLGNGLDTLAYST